VDGKGKRWEFFPGKEGQFTHLLALGNERTQLLGGKDVLDRQGVYGATEQESGLGESGIRYKRERMVYKG